MFYDSWPWPLTLWLPTSQLFHTRFHLTPGWSLFIRTSTPYRWKKTESVNMTSWKPPDFIASDFSTVRYQRAIDQQPILVSRSAQLCCGDARQKSTDCYRKKCSSSRCRSAGRFCASSLASFVSMWLLALVLNLPQQIGNTATTVHLNSQLDRCHISPNDPVFFSPGGSNEYAKFPPSRNTCNKPMTLSRSPV